MAPASPRSDGSPPEPRDAPPPACGGSGPSRRQVLGAGAAAALACAGLGGCALFLEKAAPDLHRVPVDQAFTVPLASIPARDATKPYLVVALSGRADKVMLFRAPGGELDALSMTCTHLGCDVGYDGAQGVVVCPCHGSRYDVHGANLKGPATEPLQHYPLTVAGDGVTVHLDQA